MDNFERTCIYVLRVVFTAESLFQIPTTNKRVQTAPASRAPGGDGLPETERSDRPTSLESEARRQGEGGLRYGASASDAHTDVFPRPRVYFLARKK